jgi:hypothetical protein
VRRERRSSVSAVTMWASTPAVGAACDDAADRHTRQRPCHPDGDRWPCPTT